jgi:hypothetical protein
MGVICEAIRRSPWRRSFVNIQMVFWSGFPNDSRLGNTEFFRKSASVAPLRRVRMPGIVHGAETPRFSTTGAPTGIAEVAASDAVINGST